MPPTIVMISGSEKTAIETALQRAFRHSKTEEVLIPVGYRAQVAFEEHSGLFIHLTLSLIRPHEPNAVPSSHAIRMIAYAFGIPFPIEGKVWTEEYEPGHSAVHIVVIADPVIDRIMINRIG